MIGALQRNRILAVGAHPDDIELGCYGTLRKLSAKNQVMALILTRGGDDDGSGRDRIEESRAALRGVAEVLALDFPVGHFGPTNELVGVVDRVLASERPDLVFTLTEWDTHQDHRAAGQVVRAALRRRPVSLIGYQSVTVTPAFPTNLIVDIAADFDLKLEALRCHASQQKNPYFGAAWLRQWHHDKGATAVGLGCVELLHVYQMYAGSEGAG